MSNQLRVALHSSKCQYPVILDELKKVLDDLEIEYSSSVFDRAPVTLQFFTSSEDPYFEIMRFGGSSEEDYSGRGEDKLDFGNLCETVERIGEDISERLFSLV